MDLTFKLKPGKTILDAAKKVEQFNSIAAALLVNGPIKVNTADGIKDEDRIGDVCTPANEFGYATARIGNYRKLILDGQMLIFFSDTFEVVVGQAVEDTPDGEVAAGGFA